jgi:Fe-S oxidoreductase
MKILALWPPEVPSYFNAGHHNTFWEVAAYLRRLPFVREVRAFDAGVLNWTWAAVARELAREPDLLAIHNEFDTLHAVRSLVSYCREISPQTRIVTFGRASGRLAGFFKRYDFDAIVGAGDWEAALGQYAEFLANARPADQLSGLLLRNADGGFTDTGPGSYLPPEEWAFPDPAEVPWDLYNRLYENGILEFSGLPRLRELPITIARGCPLDCDYCLVPSYQGLRERRRSVAAVLEYADRARQFYDFDYISTYAPTFTLKRAWVMEFCRAIAANQAEYRWKTCTTLHHLDEPLLDAMARSRCLRVSVGLETLDSRAQALLPTLKRIPEDHLRDVARWCSERGIELTCFVILGMPGQSAAGLAHTFRVVRDIGARIRPTAYTPYHQLREDMDEEQFLRQSRQIVSSDSVLGLSRRDFYQLEFGDRDAVLDRFLESTPSTIGRARDAGTTQPTST